MATPTISFAAMSIASARKSSQKMLERNKTSNEDSSKKTKDDNESNDNDIYVTPPSRFNLSDTKLKKFWGEEVDEEAIYSVYLKKINYSSNSSIMNLPSKIANFRPLKGYSQFHDTLDGGSQTILTKCDEADPSDYASVNDYESKSSEAQCLQWETRQTRILKAATLDHIVKYILLLTCHQNNGTSNGTVLEDERNNVAHAMHVIFCIYRLYCSPHEFYDSIMKFSTQSCAKQFNFVMHYWIENYPEDFRTFLCTDSNNSNSSLSDSDLSHSSSSTSTSEASSSSLLSTNSSSSDRNPKKRMLIDLVLLQHKANNSLYQKALTILEMKEEQTAEVINANQKSLGKSSSSSVLELDPRFIAQQLTAIDLENFLSLKPYSLLTGSRLAQKTPKMQSMIRNFNLLSRHVIITILKSHSPLIVTTHWIEVALQLRKIRNFNSLKAIIAGLTNESIFRLKQTVWSKLSRASSSTFKWLSTIVDDVNNQTLLRHTQLIIEGTSKVSLEDESFGTIPYLGTFLTDITVIDSKYPSYIQSANNNNIRLINFEKCSQQYEILMQIQLLQKNVIAALTSLQQQTQQITRVGKPCNPICPPQVPRVARIFRVWFQSKEIASMTDRQCYELSLALEATPVKSK